jgi:hypothetical protein
MPRRKPHLHFSRPFRFFPPFSSSPPPCPHGPRTSQSQQTPEHAGNAARAPSRIRPRRGHPPHTASPLLGSPNFFFLPLLSSLSLSPPYKSQFPNPNIFPSLPRLAHRRRRCSTLLWSPPPPRQVNRRALWPPLDRESLPRSLDDASRPPRPRCGRWRGSASGVRVRVAGRYNFSAGELGAIGWRARLCLVVFQLG